ncbi:MAG: hypothetical protein U0936_06815 [Planctomycetaceae bacterium]
MSLPTCPSCGQSVLEDNPVDCPFCGAAMDGSRGAKNTPRPKANPVANRPGARKLPEKPAEPVAAAAPTPETPKPVARPIGGQRGGKPVVDEDDPFGVGMTSASAQAIQATAKPEKGRLLKVVCPMCEQVGFVPKNAVGKSVKCANEKCMVPIFTAHDPSEQAADRKPVRMSDEAEAARRAAEAAKPKKRNPMVIYGIVGGVLLLLTMALIPLLNKPPDHSQFNKPVVLPDFGPTEDELAKEEEEKARKLKAALDAINPHVEVEAHVKRMIGMARMANLRDKAWARRMTGDLFMRLNQPALGAQEFNQNVVIEGGRGYYRIEPNLTRYWRAIAADDPEAAAKALGDALAETKTLPRTGRLGLDAAMGLASAMVNAGRIQEAVEVIAARQLDTTIADNRDAIATTAWSFASGRCRDASVEGPMVLDALLWINPLHVGVAIDLGLHERWAAAIAWSKTSNDPRTLTDSLVALAETAAAKKALPEAFAQIEQAIEGSDSVSVLRVKAAVAAATKDVGRFDACLTLLGQVPVGPAAELPESSALVQDDVRDHSQFVYTALSVSEVLRAAVASGKKDQAGAVITRLLAELSAIAPSTTQIRGPINQMAANESGFKKQLAAELRVPEDTQFGAMYRNYRKHIEQYAKVAEDRRLLETILLARVIRAGGTAELQAALSASPELKQELLLDELSGFLAITARRFGSNFPEVLTADGSLRQGRALFGNAALIVPIAGAADRAWATHAKDLASGLRLLETIVTDLPGLRQALSCELVEVTASTTIDPGYVLTAISKMQNILWREECYIVAGRVFADRKLDKKADEWLAGSKVLPLEQICLLYGASLGILERPLPVVDALEKADEKKAPDQTKK